MTAGAQSKAGEAELIFHGGRIYTVDASRSWAQAVAVRGGKIAAVGSDAEVMKCRGATTKVHDLGGRMMMPGLVDVHNHHTRGGEMDLFDVTFQAYQSFDEILALVKARASKLPPGEWICGGIWSSELIPRLSQMAAKAALDAVSPDHPVMLRDDSMHNRWVNSRALEMMGVDSNTPDPSDGEIIREQGSGKPVGLLFEKASALAERALASGINDRLSRDTASTRRAVEILNSYGVTAYQDANTTLPMLKALAALDGSGELNAWCVASLPAFDTLSGTELFGDGLIARRDEFRSAHVRPDFIKLFMDGVPMTRTAAMLAPYAPDQQGHSMFCRSFIAVPEMVRWIAKAEKLGMAIKVHCAGDAAVRDVLDAVEIVRDFHGPGPAHHIAHAGFVDPDDIPRFSKLNVVADLCPAIWVPSPIIASILSVLPERGPRYWPNKDLLEAGALLAAGSDWPVVGLPDPWFGLEGMVTRRNPRGSYPGALWEEQALDLATVLEIYTRNPARAMRMDDLIGSIETGKSADLIVLDRNLFECPVDELADTRVLSTYFEGRLVHSR